MANELDKTNMNTGAEGQESKPAKKKAVAILNLQYSKSHRNEGGRNNRNDNGKSGQGKSSALKTDPKKNTAKSADKTAKTNDRANRNGDRPNDKNARRENGDTYRPSALIRPRANKNAVRPSSVKDAEAEAREAAKAAMEAAAVKEAEAEKVEAVEVKPVVESHTPQINTVGNIFAEMKAAEEAAKAAAEAAKAQKEAEEAAAKAAAEAAAKAAAEKAAEEAAKAEKATENVYRVSGNIFEDLKAQEEREIAARQNRDRQNKENRQNKEGRQDRPNRGQGDRSNRGQGDRQDRPNRGQGDRPNRGQGDRQDRPNRGQGDRQDRPNRGQGDRQDRPNRSQDHSSEMRDNRRDDRNNRSQGDRQDRNFRGADKDERQNDRFGGNRQASGGRFNKEAAAPAGDEVRGKESRERGAGNRRTDNNKRPQDHDKLGKRQENYINLEKHGGKKKPQQPQAPKEDPNEIKTLVLPEKMTIRELADFMKLQPSAIIKNLFMKGKMVTMNSEVTYDDAEELAMEFNFVCEPEEKVDVIAELLKEDEENEDEMITRPPVVCVMGHVDHGKTSLLDAIRSTRVTDREAGGITQHIGASVVSIDGQKITFLDTPGHEAFTAMRMRGASSTDIAILVVAADDGVMPQTIEAINHAKAAGVEIIVAVNKIDKPGADIERVKQEMTKYDLVAEDWGGSTIFCPVSAKTKEGIDELLEMVLLTADVLELKANPKRNARGLVIEAQLDKGRGSVATMLVQKGTLHVGDCVACGSSYGKVRAMIDDKGRRVKEAGPSTPVEILGLNNVPSAGETFVVCDNEKEAKNFADTYIAEEKNRLLEETKARMSLDDLFSQIQSGNVKELNLIVKADVQGSVEAVKTSLMKLSNEEVVVKVIHGAVGAISESDVILASASNAIIIGFNVRPDAVAKATAEHENVEIRLYNVIYTAIEEIERKMKGMKDPVYEEKVIGHAEIRAIFKASGVGNIAGSYVMDGVIERGCRVRITREGKLIFEGNLASLKRFKDDVKEVKTNYECGLVFEGFGDIQEFDMVEAYKMVEVPQ